MRSYVFESPGNSGVYKKIRSSTCCHHFHTQSSQDIQSFWACFHEKEELLRVKCLLCVALLVSEQCQWARFLSPGWIKHCKALASLSTHGCLVCWEACALIYLAFSAPSSSSTEDHGSTCPGPHHLPQSPGWRFLSIQQSHYSKARVGILCLPPIKGIQHS